MCRSNKWMSKQQFDYLLLIDVTIKQIFRNDETVPIEAVYYFPIETQAAVYAFVARIDDRQISAQLKEK